MTLSKLTRPTRLVRLTYTEYSFSRWCESLGVDFDQPEGAVEAALAKVMRPADVVVAREVAREAYDLCLRSRRKSQDLGMVLNGNTGGAAGM